MRQLWKVRNTVIFGIAKEMASNPIFGRTKNMLNTIYTKRPLHQLRKSALSAVVAVAVLLQNFSARADEGMWLPIFLKQFNEEQMLKLGLQLKADEIYSTDKPSLKDAVVWFNGGCTAELISNQGLILTNHHCGFDAIAKHSTLENNYLRDGFWAANWKKELPNPGMFAAIVNRIENVTERVNGVIAANQPKTEAERTRIITQTINEISKEFREQYKGTTVLVRPMFYGAEYYAFVLDVYRDVRLVGAPAAGIGKFGGDTDNWMWPRHTGDFSIFRIYADGANLPADYSVDNQPYVPKKFFQISMQGVKPLDFTMVYGFPGRTQEYLPSFAIPVITDVLNVPKIELRSKRLDAIWKYMLSSEALKLKYASKHASIANAWKKWQGENTGLKAIGALEKKQAAEKELGSYIEGLSSEAEKQRYYNAYNALKEIYDSLAKQQLLVEFQREGVWGAEAIGWGSSWATLLEAAKSKNPEKVKQAGETIKGQIAAFHKEFHAPLDKEMFVMSMATWLKVAPKGAAPSVVVQMLARQKNDMQKLADEVYAKSNIIDEKKASALAERVLKGDTNALVKDPAFAIWRAFQEPYNTKWLPAFQKTMQLHDMHMRTFVEFQRAAAENKAFYPDANSTLRVAYGRVQSYEPANGVRYHWQTTHKGILEKYNPNEEEFKAPVSFIEKLQTNKFLIETNKGSWASKTLPVAFIATNHTTGGNSGSPVLNAKGQLIGTNFDRCWEGTMSDIMYDADRCRNIAVDIRFTLFVVANEGNAKHLLEEMDIVW